MLYLLAVLIGVIAGLRAMTAPAAIAWAAHLGWIDISGSPLAFMGHAWTPWIFTALALVELVTDQLPSTPSRTVPMQFGARIVSGALCGACLGAGGGVLLAGAVLGAIGAVIGTLGGSRARGRLAGSFGHDRPAALIEDVVAIGGALLIVAVP
ncbi:DUF4126 family protein [Ancylobacter dichloromethanicus]|uniref:Membrane protein n=1 Tax=Ancylobacter dichloromethanicus TaxID=518825 RepID=A0A9W6J9Z3_9HYPH|nr:DUF4126 family protein [Ancylobacter dichloromethanicus]MBS7552770.1 DUF4126 family protein [Ancylobacter dichloromethanicus]GLK72134.1 membrane protein [Ancylobacter dichloromethanicus]